MGAANAHMHTRKAGRRSLLALHAVAQAQGMASSPLPHRAVARNSCGPPARGVAGQRRARGLVWRSVAVLRREDARHACHLRVERLQRRPPQPRALGLQLRPAQALRPVGALCRSAHGSGATAAGAELALAAPRGRERGRVEPLDLPHARRGLVAEGQARTGRMRHGGRAWKARSACASESRFHSTQ